MAKEKWNPVGDLIAIQDRMNNLLKDALNTASLANDRHTIGWGPPADFYETEDSFVVVAEVPDFSPEEIDVKIEENLLSLTGKKAKKTADEKKRYYRRESARTSFKRSFSLPAPVKASEVKARMKHGVLEIDLPKADQSGSKAVTVTVER
jgi:HSP20 family protein